MSPTPATLPQGVLFPPNQFGPPSLGWSQLIDYGGGTAPLYIMWYPTASGQSTNGYIQKFTYASSSVTNIQWAVTGTPGTSKCSVASEAAWANRATTVVYN